MEETCDGDIRFVCPACQKHMVIEASGAGATIKCVDCGQPVTVPRRIRIRQQAEQPQQSESTASAQAAEQRVPSDVPPSTASVIAHHPHILILTIHGNYTARIKKSLFGSKLEVSPTAIPYIVKATLVDRITDATVFEEAIHQGTAQFVCEPFEGIPGVAPPELLVRFEAPPSDCMVIAKRAYTSVERIMSSNMGIDCAAALAVLQVTIERNRWPGTTSVELMDFLTIGSPRLWISGKKKDIGHSGPDCYDFAKIPVGVGAPHPSVIADGLLF